jgi:hypothetical protein
MTLAIKRLTHRLRLSFLRQIHYRLVVCAPFIVAIMGLTVGPHKIKWECRSLVRLGIDAANPQVYPRQVIAQFHDVRFCSREEYIPVVEPTPCKKLTIEMGLPRAVGRNFWSEVGPKDKGLRNRVKDQGISTDLALRMRIS